MTQPSTTRTPVLSSLLARASLLLFGYLAVVIVFFVSWIHHKDKHFLEATDTRLRTAAAVLPYLLAEDFHDRAVNATAIGMEEELRNRENFNAFVRDNDLVYAYTLVKSDGKLHFSSPTISPAEAQSRRSWYFYPYEDAPPELSRALDEGHDVSLTYKDDWGDFHTTCLFETSPGGRPYLACADVETSDLEAVYTSHMLLGLGGAVALLGFLAPLFFLIRHFYRMHMTELAGTHEKTQVHLELLSTLVHRLPVGLMLVQPDNRISLVNPAFTALTGYSREDIPTRNAWFRRIYPNVRDRRRYLKDWAHTLKNAEDATTQMRITRKDGTSRSLSQQLRLLEDGRILIILDDVTGEQENQARVRQDMERLRTILDAMQVGIAVVGVSDRRIRYVNPRLTEMTGWSQGMLHNALCYRHLGRQCESQCPVIDRGEVVQNREVQLAAADRSPWHVLKSVVRAEIGGEAVVIESFSDITGPKKLEMSLTAAREATEKINRDTSAFLTEMNRRLHASLHAAVVPLKMLQNKVPEEVRNFAVAVQTAVKEFQDMLRQALELSALSPRDIAEEPFAARLLATSLGDLYEKAGEKGVSFVCRTAPDLPDTLLGDMPRIVRILHNLAEESIASTEQECVRLEISPLPFRHSSGRGIVHFGLYETPLDPDEKSAPHLFGEAGTALHSHAEAGMGVVLARRLLGIMGSGLCVMTDSNGRTEAHFSLPLIPPETR